MSDADVQITAGTGTKIDTRTVGAGTDEHRQVMVVGDPTTAANVASVDGAGLHVRSGKAATSTVTQVASSASNVTLQASNTSRVALTVFNDSTQTLFLKMGATASSTSFTAKVEPQGYWEMPTASAVYTGTVDGIWASANGNAYVTELAP